jgi:hypothetical protein
LLAFKVRLPLNKPVFGTTENVIRRRLLSLSKAARFLSDNKKTVSALQRFSRFQSCPRKAQHGLRIDLAHPRIRSFFAGGV